MSTTDYLFDTRPYRSATVKIVPLERPTRSAIEPEVWRALLRVKDALDQRERPQPSERRR